MCRDEFGSNGFWLGSNVAGEREREFGRTDCVLAAAAGADSDVGGVGAHFIFLLFCCVGGFSFLRRGWGLLIREWVVGKRERGAYLRDSMARWCWGGGASEVVLVRWCWCGVGVVLVSGLYR